MPDTEAALGGRTTHVFAGIPVRNLAASIDWYKRLLGSSPSFFPNGREAVWALAEERWLYLIVEPERAGGAIQTIMVDDLEAVVEEIAARDLKFAREERPAANVRKVMYDDPDGNEIGLGRIPKG